MRGRLGGNNSRYGKFGSRVKARENLKSMKKRLEDLKNTCTNMKCHDAFAKV